MTPSSPTGAAPTLSLVVPAFNEEILLEPTVRRLHEVVAQQGLSAEIVIVDDGSGDGTPAIADRLAATLPRTRAVHQVNTGIGGAFRSGAKLASGDYLMLWPADMHPVESDLTPYLTQFGKSDVVVGFRRYRTGYNALMLVNAWLYPRLVGWLFGLRLRDVNWIHAYRREIFNQLRITQTGIPMLAETLVRLRDAGATFVEVEVQMRPRTAGVPSARRIRASNGAVAGSSPM
jgi:glycosyltransferase involved in cell wall biosynthesis